MKNRLVLLAGIAVLLLIAAVWVVGRQAPERTLAGGGALVGGLSESINAVDGITLVGAGDTVLVSLRIEDGRWVVSERANYPADFGKIRRLLLDLSQARRIEAKTQIAANFARLGVEDVSAADATGVRIDLSGTTPPVSLIVGRFTGLAGEGTFIRDADGEQAWLASGSLIPDRTPANWLDHGLLDISSSRIRAVEIRNDDSLILAGKASPEQASFSLSDLPRGREPSGEFAADALAGVLAELKLEDVLPAAQAPMPDAGVIEATYSSFDGLVIEVRAWQADGENRVRFTATADAAAARAAPASAPGGPAEASAPAAAESPIDSVSSAPGAAQTSEQRLAERTAEADALNRRFEGWVFQLPPHVYANINQRLDGLLKPLE